ncbi:hypothetical protein JL720_10090 [Aureococcus anophagefferens]|nr:hypothetical protein JL720_10090 [Aureococcus anophagefferens]
MDEAKAKQLYRMAADRGDYIAQMNLGGLLLAEKNDDEAYRWFLLAAQQGFTAAELQVELDEHEPHGRFIMAPEDDDHYIRSRDRPGRR